MEIKKVIIRRTDHQGISIVVNQIHMVRKTVLVWLIKPNNGIRINRVRDRIACFTVPNLKISMNGL